MLENITNATMSFLLVSLPEESMWVLAVMITLKRFDLLDKYRWKENIKWLSIPILSSSFIICFLRYIIDAPRLIISLSAIFAIYIGIIIILKSPKNNIFNEKINYIKIFFCVIFNFAVLIVLVESLYSPILLAYIKSSIIDINNTWSMNLLLSTPARVIQFCIILIILSLQNREVYLSILHSIFSDKRITFAIIIFIFVLVVFWTLLINIFGNYNILSQYGLNEQILFSIMLFLVPSILLILMIYLVILFIEKINQMQRSHQNMFDDVFDDDIYKC